MSDIGITYSNQNQFGDVDIFSNDLVRDEGLETSVLISLFTDRRIVTDAQEDQDSYKGGYVFEDVDNIKYGSRLFTLDRSKTDKQTIRLIANYAKEALQWLIDKKIAEEIDTKAIVVNGSRIDLVVSIFKDDEAILDKRYEDLWAATFEPITFPSAPGVIQDVTPVFPEPDSEWNFSKYTTPIEDSWQTPRFVLIDDGPEANDATLTNPKSDGISGSRVVRVEHSRAAPDGLGGLFCIPRPQQLVSDVAELMRFDASAIDFSVTDEFTFSVWLNCNDVQTRTNYLLSQGSNISDGLHLSAFVQSTGTVDPWTVKFTLQTHFGTTGAHSIETATIPAHGWICLMFTQTADSVNIYIDNVDSAGGVVPGATGIEVLTNTPLALLGNTNTTGNSSDWRGMSGQYFRYWKKALDSSERQAVIDDASNWDGANLLADNGDAGQVTSINSSGISFYGSDRKTMANVPSFAEVSCFMQRPIFRGEKIECQFRVNGNATNNGMIGVSGDYYGANRYVGEVVREYGMWFKDRTIWHAGGNVGGISGAALPDGTILTLLLDLTTFLDIEILIDDVSWFSQSSPFDMFGAEGLLHIACGYDGNTSTDTIDVLSTLDDIVYPVKSGYTLAGAS